MLGRDPALVVAASWRVNECSFTSMADRYLNFNSNRPQGVTMMTIFVVSMMAIWALIAVIVFAKKDQ